MEATVDCNKSWRAVQVRKGATSINEGCLNYTYSLHSAFGHAICWMVDMHSISFSLFSLPLSLSLSLSLKMYSLQQSC